MYKSHKKGELEIALSNALGDITQVMFLVFPFTLTTIAIIIKLGFVNGIIPIDFTTTILFLLLFPIFYVLLQYLEEDHTLSNLDAIAMTGIYTLVVYMLLMICSCTN